MPQFRLTPLPRPLPPMPNLQVAFMSAQAAGSTATSMLTRGAITPPPVRRYAMPNVFRGQVAVMSAQSTPPASTSWLPVVSKLPPKPLRFTLPQWQLMRRIMLLAVVAGPVQPSDVKRVGGWPELIESVFGVLRIEEDELGLLPAFDNGMPLRIGQE